MRKKIGKRIGPVPITLVAVFALAAFISAGFWLVPNGGQTAEAQGLPNTPTAGGGDDECAVIVNGTGSFVAGIVSGGGCTVSDDSVDVMFENADANLDKSIAVYVTGGEQFSSLQAMNTTGMPIGAQGIDEYLLTVPDDEVGFAGTENGSQTVTVSRDMAKNGEVYLFVYLTDTENTKTFDPAAIPLSGLVNDKVRTRTNENTLLAMLSTSSGTIVADANDIRTSALAFDHDNDGNTVALIIIDGTAIPAVTEATPSNQKQADGTTDDSNVIRADVDPEQDTLDMAKAIVAAVKDASQYEAFAEASNNKAEIAALELNIRRAQATIDAIDGGDPDYWPGIVDAPLAVEVVFTNAAATAKLKSDGTYGGPAAPGEEDTYTLGSTLFTGRGSLSSNEPISSGADTADVEVTIRDALGVELSGFVDFSVDTSAAGAADVVIAASSTSNHRVKLNDGVARVQVTDLETNVALKIPVTVSYGSDFEIMGYIVRLGDAMMVEAAGWGKKGR
jgi:hypothetical protein